MDNSTALTPDLRPGDLAIHDLGLKLEIVGPPAVATAVARLRCRVVDPGFTGLARGQQGTFRVAHMTPL